MDLILPGTSITLQNTNLFKNIGTLHEQENVFAGLNTTSLLILTQELHLNIKCVNFQSLLHSKMFIEYTSIALLLKVAAAGW